MKKKTDPVKRTDHNIVYVDLPTSPIFWDNACRIPQEGKFMERQIGSDTVKRGLAQMLGRQVSSIPETELIAGRGW